MTCVPVESQTVNWTFTFAVAAATAPQPTLRSANWSPEGPGWSVAGVANESNAEAGRTLEQSGGTGVMWLLTGTALPHAASARTAIAAPTTVPARPGRGVPRW